MNFEEILSALDELKIEKEEFGWHDIDTDALTEKVGEYEVADEHGGEGQGDEMHIVYHFKKHDIYIRLDGWYSSYGESSWDGDYQEVRPTERTVTFYE